MSRKTRLSRARLTACANYWRNHIAIRTSSAPHKAGFAALRGQRPHDTQPTRHKPGPAA